MGTNTVSFLPDRSWLRTQLRFQWTEWCTSESVTPLRLWPTLLMLTSLPVSWLKPPSEMSLGQRTWLSSCLTVRASLIACRCGSMQMWRDDVLGVFFVVTSDWINPFILWHNEPIKHVLGLFWDLCLLLFCQGWMFAKAFPSIEGIILCTSPVKGLTFSWFLVHLSVMESFIREFTSLEGT